MKEGSAIFLYYRNFGLGQTLKWMTGIHRIERLASINVALKRCQTELFHLSFKCSVHCLVISHHPFFIIFSGYPLRERARGTKICDSSTIIQFISSQFNSMLRKHNWIMTQCGKFSDMIYRIKNQYLRWDFWIGTTECFTNKIQDCDNCLNGSVNGFQIILCSSYLSCITSIIRTSHDRAFQKIKENSIWMMTSRQE